MRALLSAATLIAVLGYAAPSEAQQFTLRTGLDVRPLVAFRTSGPGDGVATLGDIGWLGIHIVPGLQIAKVLAIEVGLVPLIPLTGEPKPDFAFLVSPGIRLDLQLFYARAAIPIAIATNTRPFFEAAAGISFIGSGYLGLLLDYDPDLALFMIGAEVGWKFGF